MTESNDLGAPADLGQSQRTEARSFVVLAVAAGFTAWELGFDFGAFETIDHRRFWAIWILSTIALAASLLFRNHGMRRFGMSRLILATPTIWLIADFVLAGQAELLMWALTIVTVATLPFALYLIAQLLAGDFFALVRRSQVALVVLTVGIFITGLYVGAEHDRFLTCDDFARAGDYVPPNCAE